MDYYQHLEHVQKYSEAFWQHEIIDRPYLCVQAPIEPHVFIDNAATEMKACVSGNYDQVVDAMLNHCEKTYFGAEAMPHLLLTLGPDQYAAFLGGTVETSEEGYTTWVNPCLDDLEGFEVKIDKSPDGYFEKLRRYIEYTAKKAEGHFMIDMLDLHSNMDAISALRSAQETCFDIFDCPEEVHRVLDAVNATYGEVYDMAYRAGNMEKAGTIGWQPVYCKGKSATLQCDFSCVLGPEQGREFVFPAIEQEASHLDHAVYHLDGKDALCHLDTILGLDFVDCVQWVPGSGQPRSMEWMDVLHKIQAAGKAVWIYDWTVDEIKQLHKELDPTKVAYDVCAASVDEADSLIEYLEKNT